MSGYTKDKIKSVLLIVFCCAFVAAAVLGIYKAVSIVTWTAQIKTYRREIGASIEHAEAKFSMYITVNDEEPVRIHFSDVYSFHRYLVTTPQTLPASESIAGSNRATIDCGDGSVIEVFDAGARQMRLRYTSPEGNTYRYTLRYHTEYDGWDYFVRMVQGENRPG